MDSAVDIADRRLSERRMKSRRGHDIGSIALSGQGLCLLGSFADEPFEFTVTAVGAVPPAAAAAP